MLDLKTLKPLIRQIAEEKGLSEERVFEALEVAFAAAYKKEYGKRTQAIHAKINPDNGVLEFWQTKIALDENSIITDEEIENEESQENTKKQNEKTQKDIAETDDQEFRKVKFNPELLPKQQNKLSFKN